MKRWCGRQEYIVRRWRWVVLCVPTNKSRDSKGLWMQCIKMWGLSSLPWWDITALLHEGPQWEPKGVEDAELIGLLWTLLVGVLLRCRLALLHPVRGRSLSGTLWLTSLLVVLSVPLVRAESADKEQDNADANVGKHYAHPDLISQGVQEWKHARFGFSGFLDHDGDTQWHEGLGEVDHFFTDQSDGQRSHSHICFLREEKEKQADKLTGIYNAHI